MVAVRPNLRGFWVWPDAGGRADPDLPRRVDGGYAEDYKWIRRAPEDLTGRPRAFYPPAVRPSSLYEPRVGGGLLYRYPGMGQGVVRPFNIRVERSYLRDLIQHPYRSRYQPIMEWCPRPYHLYDLPKTARALPVRKALAYPTLNYRATTDEDMLQRARERAGLIRGRRRR